MAGFLYFKPGHTNTITLPLVKEWGLGYAFTAKPNGTVCMQNTPNGRNGFVFGDLARLGDWQPIMQMEEQAKWKKVPGTDCYVSYWTAAPPTPEDLARPQQLPGYRITSGDHEWIVPLTARFNEAREQLVTVLPCYIDCDDNGNWIEGDVLAVHEQLWKAGAPFRADLLARILDGAAPREFTQQELYSAALGYLQANYVVGQAELVLMRGLSNDVTIHAAIQAANDMPTFLKWAEQKKNTEESSTPATSTSSSGAAD
jgi:hypothetical protein